MNDDERTTDACLSYKLTCEPSAQVSLKHENVQNNSLRVLRTSELTYSMGIHEGLVDFFISQEDITTTCKPQHPFK